MELTGVTLVETITPEDRKHKFSLLAQCLQDPMPGCLQTGPKGSQRECTHSVHMLGNQPKAAEIYTHRKHIETCYVHVC